MIFRVFLSVFTNFAYEKRKNENNNEKNDVDGSHCNGDDGMYEFEYEQWKGCR